MGPETRYVRSGEVSIAYQVFGDGPFDVVIMLPGPSHVELGWEAPLYRALFEDRGSHELKGIPGEWRLYAAV